MKHFPGVLHDVIKERGLNQVEMGTLSGLGQLKISRLVNGVIRPDREDFEALFSPAVHLEHEQKARLAFAQIKDELPPETFQHLHISQPVEKLREIPGLGLEHLSARAQASLRYLLSLQDDFPGLGDLFIEMAKLAGWKEETAKKPAPTPYSKTDNARKIRELVKKSAGKPAAYPPPKPE